MNFTLHTEPITNPPEFTITCLSHGGPATVVNWHRNRVLLHEDSNHTLVKKILDTNQNTTYENSLCVRGRETGVYSCHITNNLQLSLPNAQGEPQSAIEVIKGS